MYTVTYQVLRLCKHNTTLYCTQVLIPQHQVWTTPLATGLATFTYFNSSTHHNGDSSLVDTTIKLNHSYLL